MGADYSVELIMDGSENMDCGAVLAVGRVVDAACESAEERYKGRLNSEAQHVVTLKSTFDTRALGSCLGCLDQSPGLIVIVKSYLSLEPIGILFVLFFAVILVIQFIGMIMHRLSTLSHLLASTTLRIGSKSSEIDLNNGIVNESVIEDLKKIAKLPDVNNLDMGKPQVSGPRKTTIAHLLQRADKELTVGTIAESLNNVFESVTDTKGPLSKRLSVLNKDTRKALIERKSTVTQRRLSQLSQRSSGLSSTIVPIAPMTSMAPRYDTPLPKRKVSFVNKAFQPDEQEEHV
uniref:Uncharacterized protein n=1 Tax=Timema monikensis TaxID=170555 RepID=A0A7R9EIQ6_9NEOP|nr:unnamed protein product [Timema monikensis]